MKTLVLTASDAKYFPLATGTVLSLRRHSACNKVELGFLDMGCTVEQLRWLMDHDVRHIRRPGWDIDFPRQATAPLYLRGLFARPFLRRYFPSFDLYFWIDADAWVQDWLAIELFLEGASRSRGMAIVPQLHRASLEQYGRLPEIRAWLHYHFKAFFGEDVAGRLDTYPVINAGVFALHHEAPHWEVWARLLREGAQRLACIMTDQFALNLAIYEHALFERTELLPAWCNWIFNAMPAWDPKRLALTEPYLPLHPIGILHLAGQKAHWADVPITSGGRLRVPTHYAEFQQFVDSQRMP